MHDDAVPDGQSKQALGLFSVVGSGIGTVWKEK